MNGCIELWRIQEIRNVKQLIKETEQLIRLYENESRELIKSGDYSIKDFGLLNAKYGDKKFNKAMVGVYYKRLHALQRGCFNSKEEYNRTMML